MDFRNCRIWNNWLYKPCHLLCWYFFAIEYTYDQLNRLSTITYDNGITVTYTYDQWGNRKTQTNTGSSAKSGETGSLIAAVRPRGEVDAGAKCQADDSARQDSGATVTGLNAGRHTVTLTDAQGWTAPAGPRRYSGETLLNLDEGEHPLLFDDVTGWVAPNPRTITIVNGPAVIQQAGSLAVTIDRQDEVIAGAQWQVTGNIAEQASQGWLLDSKHW